jgi:hypothetical protein
MKIHHPSNTIDYLLTETRSQLVAYSQMADMKANILLSMSAVLGTLAAANLSDPAWILPDIVLVTFLMAAVLLALLAVIPNLRLVRTAKHSTRDPDFNTLFFAHFAAVPYEDYAAHMEQVMNDPSRVYEAQVREIHSAGVYLQATKFRYIKYGYLVFFAGLILSVAVRIAELLWR